MPTLKIGALTDTEIATQIQTLQSEQTRRAKMRDEAVSFVSGAPGRLAFLTSVLNLSPASNGNGQHKVTAKVASKPAKAASPNMPKPIRIMYRNPANSQETWSGRGRPARWITEAIKAGKAKSKDEFLVA